MNINNIFTSPTSPYDPHSAESPMSGNRSESLAELWSGFLEREAQEGGSSHSRRTSVSTLPAGAAGRGSRSTGPSIREDGGEG